MKTFIKTHRGCEVTPNNNIWPRKRNILGVGISSTDYDELLEVAIDTAKARRAACISHLAVHGLVTASADREMGSILNDFECVAPDGMPVKIALNVLYNAKLPDRVYGPEFTLRVCERAAAEGIGVYLYGSYPDVDEVRPDLIIHCAAQPSHDLAAKIPFKDFEVNAIGTLNLLEATRQSVPESVFIL